VHNLTEEQKESLKELKTAIKHEITEYKCPPGSWFQLDDDLVLLKFLRARNFDVKEAMVLVHYHVDMRRNWNMDELKASDPDIKKGLDSGVWTLAGESKAGHPIQLIRTGLFIPADVESMEAYWRSLLYQRELTVHEMVKRKWKTETTVVVFDMEGWSLWVQGAPSAMKYTQILVDVSQNGYPEFLEKAIIFNAPWVFRTAWAIIHPWLDPATAGRVLFVTDPNELHEFIDPAMLEVKYGGTRTTPWPTYGA